MDAERFRRHAHAMVDWVADYLAGAERYPVSPNVAPGEVRGRLPVSAPAGGEEMETIWRDFEEIVLPAITHWNHPRFFGYFPATNSGPSILGELLSAALGVNAMVWHSSPAATELEECVMDWLRQLVGLPEAFRGVIEDTASSATLVALLCARERATEFRSNALGMSVAGGLRVYASREAHSSVEKAVKIAGLGRENLVLVDVDDNGAMRPDALQRLMMADQRAGRRPCAVVTTIGTTSSTGIDPVAALAPIAAEHGAWLHVDAALAGAAAILPEKQHLFEGLPLVDSFVMNPHKWLFVNFDCSAFFCRHPDVLVETLAIFPEYLKTPHDRVVTNFRDWGIPLGRRFRALKLWFVLRSFGVEGLRARLRGHLALAEALARSVDDHPHFERLAPVPLQTVCFRLHPHCEAGGAVDEEQLDRWNAQLLSEVNGTGRAFLTHTRLKGRFALRFSIGQTETQREHVEEGWRVITNAPVVTSCTASTEHPPPSPTRLPKERHSP